MINFQAKDVIAVVVLVALFATKLLGYDGVIDAMIALVIGYYFSKRVYEERSANPSLSSSNLPPSPKNEGYNLTNKTPSKN